jgi:hypothetical protein
MSFLWVVWIVGILFTLGAFPINGSFMMRVLLGILILLFWPIMLGIMVRNVYVKYVNE